ncbi:MAG TPA: hypothetical protein VHK91_05445 [Flavisolibacter sp.]|nr:hypothetical protein [Flavisolibacter sp.]
MKRMIISLSVAAIFALSCGTTSSTSTSSSYAFGVPGTLSSEFLSQYPDATNVTWSDYSVSAAPVDWELLDWPRNLGGSLARFDNNNERYFAWYDPSGNWIGSAYRINEANRLPQGVHTLLTARYPGYSIESSYKVFWKDKQAFELRLRNGAATTRVLTDASGNVLKAK